MRMFLMTLSVFAFMATSLASLAHAELLCDPSSEICASEHVDKEQSSNDAEKDGCDIACYGCHAHCHHHVVDLSSDSLFEQSLVSTQRIFGTKTAYISNLIYGLKRPPKA